jgi:hypothetical protein
VPQLAGEVERPPAHREGLVVVAAAAMGAAEDREVHRLVADVADPSVDRQRLVEPGERAIQAHPREIRVRDLRHGELQHPQVVVPAVDLGEPCGQPFQRLEVAGLERDLLQRIHRHRLRVLVVEGVARPERPLAERERRVQVQTVRVDDREAAQRADLAFGVAERRRGPERRLQVRDRHPVVGRPGEHEPELVVRAHRDLGRHLGLGEHLLEIVPRARHVARPRADPRTRQEPLGDVGVGRRLAELGRELERRGEVREGLVAGVQAFGPFGGEVVPSTSRLQIAGGSVMMREKPEVLVDPLGPQLLDRRGGRGMQLSAPALQQRPVRDLLDQRVREPHLVWLTVSFEQAGAHQLVRLRPGIGPDQTLEQGQVDPTPQHRRSGDHVSRSRRERVEPRQDHLLDRRRQLDARTVIGRNP